MSASQRLLALLQRLQKHSKAELQALCAQLGKSTSGTKDDLIQRLLK